MKQITKLFATLGITLIIGGSFLFNQLQIGNVSVGLNIESEFPDAKYQIQ